MSTPTLAIVTVTYSPGVHLAQFLDSIPAATSLPVHVIMADNGSVDGAPEQAVLDYGGTPGMTVQLLHTGGNIGYGPAINRAVAILETREDIHPDYFVVSNPDVVFSPGSLDALLEAARRWERVGAVGPLIREPDGTVYPSARAVPQVLTGIGHALLAPIWPGNPWTREYWQNQDMDHERPAGWLSGSCLVLSRSAFHEVGGFDEGYFMYMEDVDLGDRLGRAGWQNIFCPSVEIGHAQGHSARNHSATMIPAHHASAYKFQADRHPQWWQSPLRWVLKVGLWVRCRLALQSARRSTPPPLP